MSKEKEIAALKCLGFNIVADILSQLKNPDDWSLWKEFDHLKDTYNIGIFIYDEDMYLMSDFAQRGGIVTGSYYHHKNMKNNYNIDVDFHSWYEDNIFIQFGTIPAKLWLDSGIEELLKVSR